MLLNCKNNDTIIYNNLYYARFSCVLRVVVLTVVILSFTIKIGTLFSPNDIQYDYMPFAFSVTNFRSFAVNNILPDIIECLLLSLTLSPVCSYIFTAAVFSIRGLSLGCILPLSSKSDEILALTVIYTAVTLMLAVYNAYTKRTDLSLLLRILCYLSISAAISILHFLVIILR